MNREGRHKLEHDRALRSRERETREAKYDASSPDSQRQN